MCVIMRIIHIKPVVESGMFNGKAYTKYYISKVFTIIHFTSKLDHTSFYKTPPRGTWVAQ